MTLLFPPLYGEGQAVADGQGGETAFKRGVSIPAHISPPVSACGVATLPMKGREK
jgi:hypothetical protein